MILMKTAASIQTKLFKKVADETLSLTKGLNGVNDVFFYNEEDLNCLPLAAYNAAPPTIRFAKQTTATALQELHGSNPVGLNFASARHPGGGFLSGAKAQEEDLCRRSSLYHSLRLCNRFYQNVNNGTIYTDRLMYSPSVSIIRDQDLNLVDPTECAIISCAAPNNCHNHDPQLLKEVFERRINNVLRVGQERHSTFVLGAWGCGAFRNDPVLVATAFKKVIPRYSGMELVFAIPDDKNLDVFKRILQ